MFLIIKQNVHNFEINNDNFGQNVHNSEKNGLHFKHNVDNLETKCS